MSAFPNILFGPDQEIYNTYTDRRFTLGQSLQMLDGRRFRFNLAGAVALVASTLQQSGVPVANHILQTPAAAAVGAQSVAVALGATAVVADQYRDGQLLITAGNTGEGYSYPVDTHAAVTSSGTFTVPLKRGTTVQVAIGTTANSASLYSNPFWKTVVAATAYTSPVVGVAVGATAIGSYGWLQTRGLTPIRSDNTTTVVGQPVVASAATAGDCALASATIATTITQPVIGNIIAIGSSAHTALVDLHLE